MFRTAAFRNLDASSLVQPALKPNLKQESPAVAREDALPPI